MTTHRPVFLSEAIEALAIAPEGIYIDGTFGRGGHSHAILSQLGPKGRLIGFDKDLTAIVAAQQRFGDDARFTMIHDSFATIPNHIQAMGLMGKINGVLLDLGVSSPQLDEAERGFSFSQNGPLDMRMDVSQGESVAQLLSHIDEVTLANILYQYGEEKESRRIARTIVAARAQQPIETTHQLANIIASVMPSREKLGKHPATRSFQALRIYINRELEDVAQCLETIEPVLLPHGRLAVISFHSLEDRIVKQFMQKGVRGKEPLRGLPLREDEISREQKWRWCIKMDKPSDAEVQGNPRARSAILRVVERRA
jgi:16S rRNA (cytosine1402-N4)-methyltransferase